ncbi:unnamed protein product [Leuciscus chuanchicus]
MEGESVTLHPDLSEIQGFILIQWRFGESGLVIAVTDGKEISYPHPISQRFRDRLQLNQQTGSLTIKNTRISDTGPYKLQIFHYTGTSRMTFGVSVAGTDCS